MDTTPLSRMPLSLAVSGRIRAAILDGSLPVGEALPTEQELAQTFSVGRSTVREALRVLQAQGLLTGADTTSTARPRVTHEHTADSAATALSTALQVGAVPLGDLVELRVLLEAAALRTVTAVPDDARAAIERMRIATRADDSVAFHDADVDFHVALAGAGGNKAFGLVMTVLRDSIAGYLLSELDSRENSAATLGALLAEHEGIADAIERGAADEAADLVERHVRGFYEGRTE
ncbi:MULTISPECIES: FCD domain-containing protein [unclassified Rhodococcus (in: high G+C Gram-positive bacteria)]|uniref:FadR/GntR family transcriptional regulator n=1 Tax=unclassified Rhodococcus (in: high G+C Gram-positive bacteria) TaxID=192944 RepID=UPI00064BB098|nr:MULTISPECIES: FCD domain-containing protein [unclassified Rhodococcus (in: high G+C Gram-positive bacteria)]MDI9905803.1 FCD domain-containing protein [Rhodococcus sp. IEGM 1406]